MNTLIEQQAEAWRLAPDDARWIAQDEDGYWCSFIFKKPIKSNINWTATIYTFLVKAEINGWDWRDTLQSREQWEMLNKQELADEKCKLEAGQECEWSQHNNDQWVWLKIHALTDRMAIVSEKTGTQFGIYLSQHAFRPIQTKADKLRDKNINALAGVMKSLFKDDDENLKIFAKNLHEIGVRVLGPDERICKPLSDEQRESIRLKLRVSDAWIDKIQRELGLIEG